MFHDTNCNYSYHKNANYSYIDLCNHAHMETIGDRIIKLRTSRKWTQEDLASKVGVSRVSVTKWESGETKNMKLHNLMKLCELFHVSPEFIIYGTNTIKTIYPEPKDSNLIDFIPQENSDLQEIISDLPKLNAEELRTTKSVVKTFKNRQKKRNKKEVINGIDKK